MNNINLSEVVGFHLVNTFFSKSDFKVEDIGVYGALKKSVLDSSSKEEYVENLKKNNIIFDENSSYFNLINLTRFNTNKVKFTFLIDMQKIQKLDLYLILKSIELSFESFEIIIFGLTDIINERVLYKDNCVFLASPFEDLNENILDYIHGDYIIPINETIFFKNNSFDDIELDEKKEIAKIYFMTNNGLSHFNIFTIDFFNFISMENNLNIFDLSLSNFKSKINTLKQYNEEIYGFKYLYTFEELRIIKLIDDLFNYNIEIADFNNIKNEIIDIFDGSNNNYNLSYFYILACNLIFKSNSLNEFLLNMDNFILKSQLNWNNKSNEYLFNNYKKQLNKYVSNGSDINSSNSLFAEKNSIINNLNVELNNKDNEISYLNNYKNEFFKIKRNNEYDFYRIVTLEKKLNYFENLFNELSNSKFYKIFHHSKIKSFVNDKK